MNNTRVTEDDMTKEVSDNLQRFMNKTSLDKKSNKPLPKNKSFFDQELPNNQELLGGNVEEFDEEENDINTDVNEDEFEEDINLAFRKESDSNNKFEGSQKFFKKPNKTKNNNPLSAYFREPGIYVKLPSQGNYSSDNSINFTTNGEISVFPMTAKDEVWFKNPDALLNGVAIEKVLESCCPDIGDIRNLPINDINVLLLGLRYSSYGKALHLKSSCPKCKTENSFAVNIEDLLDNINFLEAEYSLTIGKLKIYVKPYTYDSMIKATIVTFEEAKVVQLIQNEDLTDDERKELIKDSFQRIHSLSVLLMSNSIVKIITPDNKIIKDGDFISEWLDEIDRNTYNELKAKFEEINKIGVPNNYHVKCTKCEHEFLIDLAYDPATFFE